MVDARQAQPLTELLAAVERRHLRHVLARRQCGQYDGRLLARRRAATSIENGAIGAPVGEMNVTGNIVELFAHLVELVGNDRGSYSSTLAPSLVFDDVNFSGA